MMATDVTTGIDRFSKMSDLDQVLHLVYDHSFDGDYGYEDESRKYDTNENVVAMFLLWPAGERTSYHSDDHTDYPVGGAHQNQHTHDTDAS